MDNVIVSEGKTTTEAIENGLKKLRVTRDKVEIKVLENEDKRSFFSILTPRVVKVELKLKEDRKNQKQEVNKVVKEVKKYEKDSEEVKKAVESMNTFMKEFVKGIPSEKVEYSVEVEDTCIKVAMNGEDINYLIGYRGEVLNSLQTIISLIANKEANEKIRVVVDIQGYRKKREKTLEDLAEKLAKTVIKTGKPVTLEPMTAYERKIIHSKLQNSTKVKTHSTGEEPYRKIIISLK